MKHSFLVCLLLVVPIMGCQQFNQKRSQYLPNRQRAYLNSTLLEPLRLPRGLAVQETDVFALPAYPIPEPGTLKPPSIEPPGLNHMPVA